MPMRKTIYAMIGKEYTLEHYESTKDVPLPELGGQTIRQAMIRLSEEHVKPAYGQGFWAHSLLNTLPTPGHEVRVVVVTDMGFDPEVEVFAQAFGAENCMWPQITRPGCSFEGDSRDYVGRPNQRTTVINEGDNLEQVKACAEILYNRMIAWMDWQLPIGG